MQTISKKAPRLFIWVCNGKKGKDENLFMLPAGPGKLDYVTKLIQDCKKYEEIGTPVIFAYSGKTLKEGQKKSIQELANFIPNLFVFDFNKFIEQLIDPEAPQFLRDFLQGIKDRTKECTNRILENKPDAPIIFSEFMRFITLYYNNEVREFLKTQYNIEKFKLLEAKGMIYMDFDVTGKSPGDDIVLHKLANWLFCSTHSTTADREEDLKRNVFGKNK